MLPALVSLLLLGAVPPPTVLPGASPTPGIEIVRVASPASTKSIVMHERVSASGIILYDLTSGQELLARDADTRHPMASLTKIMTAILILEHRSLTEMVTVPPLAEQIRGSTAGVKAGEHFSVLSLLKAMLIASANDVAYALATFDKGSVGAFVTSMNARAASLGLKDTHFTNPAGLDNADQYSTARDLAWLTMAALRKPTFRSIVQMKGARISDSSGLEYELRNTNELLQDSPNVKGVKTGTTQDAGECLIVLFEDGGRQYLLVLLGSADRYTDSLFIMQAVHEALSARP